MSEHEPTAEADSGLPTSWHTNYTLAELKSLSILEEKGLTPEAARQNLLDSGHAAETWESLLSDPSNPDEIRTWAIIALGSLTRLAWAMRQRMRYDEGRLTASDEPISLLTEEELQAKGLAP